MGDNSNNYSDNSFNLYQAYSYSLLLQVELSSFAYAFVGHDRLLVSAQNCELDELANPKQLSEILTATYRKVTIGLPAAGLTLIPKSLFRADRVADIARLLDVKDTDKVFAQELDSENCIVYKTPAYLAAAVQKFGFQNTVYTAKGWLKAILKTRPYGDSLYLELGKTQLQVAYFSGNILRFYNIFEYKNEEDLVYCTSLVMEELRLKPNNTSLVLSGNIIMNDKNMKRLAEFFPKMELNSTRVIDLPGQLPSHKVLSLAALFICE
jgi:hypothetical protein